MRTKLKLSILDQGVNSRRESANTINYTLEAAQLAEDLGYSRYWLAEHHNHVLAWANPSIMVGILAGLTNKIKIGSAGIVIGYYNPINVAEDYKLLSLLFPDRIDLGISRGMADPNFMSLIPQLSTEKEILLNQFNLKVEELLSFIYKTKTNKGINYNIHIPPVDSFAVPEFWMLGSGETSYKLASKFGTAYSYSLFLSGIPSGPKRDQNIFAKYRKDYNSDGIYKKPKGALALSGICLKTTRSINNIELVPFPPANILGTASQWQESIYKLQEEYDIDEFVILDSCIEYKYKLKSYENLAKIFL